MAISRLIKLPEVTGATAQRTTALYARIKAGTFPPSIKLTSRSVAWVEDEVAAVNAARIAGKSDAEIRALVCLLVAARTSVLTPHLRDARRGTAERDQPGA